MLWTEGVPSHCNSQNCAGYNKPQEIDREIKHLFTLISRAATLLHTMVLEGA